VLTAAHVLTHVGLSWIVAGLARLSVRDRWIVVLAGTLPDLDGAGIVWSQHAYDVSHRALGHGLLFAVLIVLVALLTASAPGVTAALAAVSFHVHLLIDVVGTGGLPIRYLWPLSDRAMSWDGHWVLASWQNFAVMAAVAAGVAVTEWSRRRVV
jgi:LexA-binding, inner membrane-associated putative hydrolase